MMMPPLSPRGQHDRVSVVEPGLWYSMADGSYYTAEELRARDLRDREWTRRFLAVLGVLAWAAFWWVYASMV